MKRGKCQDKGFGLGLIVRFNAERLKESRQRQQWSSEYMWRMLHRVLPVTALESANTAVI